MKVIKLKISYKDNRGSIIDLIEDESINAATIVTFKKNAIRGNHQHKKTMQLNYLIVGKIMIRTQKFGKEPKDMIMNKGDLIIVEAREKHAFFALEYSELLVLTKGPRCGNEYEFDTFRDKEPLIKQGHLV